MKMPKVDRVKLSDKLFNSTMPNHFGKICSYIIKSDNTIRASKPKLEKNYEFSFHQAQAQYVWRMLVFYVSQKRAHQCMPCCADFDLPAYDSEGKWSASKAREMAKELKELEDILLDCIDKHEWHGIKRWGNVLGNYVS